MTLWCVQCENHIDLFIYIYIYSSSYKNVGKVVGNPKVETRNSLKERFLKKAYKRKKF